MATRKTRLVIAFVLMLSLVSFFSIPASVFAEDPIVDASKSPPVPTYAVTYNAGYQHDYGQNYVVGATVTLPSVPAGYGWRLTGNDDGLLGDPTGHVWEGLETFAMIANQLNFKLCTSNGAEKTYTLLYYGNGNDSGTAPNDLNSPYIEDASVTVLGPGDLARNGYSFVKWRAENKIDNVRNFDPSDTFSMPATNVALYAQWERDSGLLFSKEVNPTTVKSKSTTVNYTFTVTNSGIFNLKNIKLNDNKLDISYLAIPDLTSGASFTTSIAFNLDNLDNSDWKNDGKVFTNVAAVTAYYDDPDPLASIAGHSEPEYDIRVTDSAIVTYVPPAPGLTFTKEVDRSKVYTTDSPIIYTFSLTNTGDFNLYNIKLNDPKLDIENFAIPSLTTGASFSTTFGPFNLGTLDPLLNWNGAEFINIASVSASYGAVQSIQTVEIDCITPVEDPQRGSIGPITDSAIVTYMPGTLTIYKDVPEVTEDGTPFTFVVTEVVNDRETSISLNNVHIPYTTTVAVSENSPLTLYELPDGEYQVEELTPPDYYTISGSAIQYVNIGLSDNREGGYKQSVTFTNNYYVPPTITTTTTTRRSTTTIVPVEPTPAGPVITPEVVLDEQVPAAPLPKTGGLDPSFLYGLGALLAGSGLVIRKRKDK